jgi:hypothetical protein
VVQYYKRETRTQLPSQHHTRFTAVGGSGFSIDENNQWDPSHEMTGPGWLPSAHVDVTHERELPNFVESNDGKAPLEPPRSEATKQYETASEQTYVRPDPFGPDPSGRSRTQIYQGSRHAPSELFHNMPAQVIGAFSDPKMKATMPTLLGLAGQHTLDRTGRLPMPDSSLSSQSAPMVQKVVSRGAALPVNPENPTNMRTNNINRLNVLPVDMTSNLGKRMKSSDVGRGKDLARSILRPQHMGDQFAPVQGPPRPPTLSRGQQQLDL